MSCAASGCPRTKPDGWCKASGRPARLPIGERSRDGWKIYVTRILRLALLAPDIVDGILAGRTDQALMLERPLPASWAEQRQRILSAFRP
jgi:hypothetical protein